MSPLFILSAVFQELVEMPLSVDPDWFLGPVCSVLDLTLNVEQPCSHWQNFGVPLTVNCCPLIFQLLALGPDRSTSGLIRVSGMELDRAYRTGLYQYILIGITIA